MIDENANVSGTPLNLLASRTTCIRNAFFLTRPARYVYKAGIFDHEHSLTSCPMSNPVADGTTKTQPRKLSALTVERTSRESGEKRSLQTSTISDRFSAMAMSFNIPISSIPSMATEPASS